MGERSAHKTFGIRCGTALTVEYHQRAIELGGSLVPIVLPIASLYGADHAPFRRVGLALAVGWGLLYGHAARQREKSRRRDKRLSHCLPRRCFPRVVCRFHRAINTGILASMMMWRVPPPKIIWRMRLCV